ncbi:MAG: aminopeptidase N [Deltaproteobacteria bacterium]|nr:aminopeptidase N [Deltaproteobacteria bacterium]
MADKPRQIIYLRDYRPPAFLVDRVELEVRLAPLGTRVAARLSVRRHPAAGPAAADLVLAGRELRLQSVALDGRRLAADRFRVDQESLTVFAVPASFSLETVVEVDPRDNTSLEGLYLSRGNYCTQCEAEGFRKITYYLDRPDVLATFRTTIIAEQNKCPVMLANGNLVDAGPLSGGRHFATWEDPFRKPCYLFALVAGKLVEIRDDYTTASGRPVSLHIYVEERNRDKCAHAMRSLQKAMRWDEETYGLEYDLNRYMIVAVDDFNMGAMENKGLNVFNSKYVLARPETATDSDYQAIEGVIAHEYFHNWTGNRVTCRDWFQLSLKEGLTVFRDQEFTADVQGRAVKRINDVRLLRNVQFPEDRGPLAHPVRPASYVEINNFYTATVYHKGAEVIRMLHTLVGAAAFRRGLRLYLERHDGQAATIEDFVAAMAAVSGRDFGQFMRWYDQAGTPVLEAAGDYDPEKQSYTLRLRQFCPPTPGQEQKEPFHLPVVMALLDRRDGRELPLYREGEAAADPPPTTMVLELRQVSEEYCFERLREEPLLSCLRNFSAPVELRLDYRDDELAFLLAHDSDEFNRWEAGQRLALRLLLRRLDGREEKLPAAFAAAWRRVLLAGELDPAFRALAVTLPAETYIGEQLPVVEPPAVFQVREALRRQLAAALLADWLAVYRQLADPGPYTVDPAAMARRSLRNTCLAYLVRSGEKEMQDLAWQQYQQQANLTDVLAALTCLADSDHPRRQEALDDFYRRWRHEPLMLDKWFAVQAAARPRPGCGNSAAIPILP